MYKMSKYIYQKQDIYFSSSYILVSFKPLKTESSKVWKNSKYKLWRNKCLVYIYIYNICIYILYIYIYIYIYIYVVDDIT